MRKFKTNIVILFVMLLLFIACHKDYKFGLPPKLILSPDLTVKTGDTLSTNYLWVKATDPDNDILTYQWFIVPKDSLAPGIIITGATGSFYIPDKSKSGITQYFVAVSDGNFQVSSDAVTVTVCDTCGI